MNKHASLRNASIMAVQNVPCESVGYVERKFFLMRDGICAILSGILCEMHRTLSIAGVRIAAVARSWQGLHRGGYLWRLLCHARQRHWSWVALARTAADVLLHGPRQNGRTPVHVPNATGAEGCQPKARHRGHLSLVRGPQLRHASSEHASSLSQRFCLSPGWKAKPHCAEPPGGGLRGNTLLGGGPVYAIHCVCLVSWSHC